MSHKAPKQANIRQKMLCCCSIFSGVCGPLFVWGCFSVERTVNVPLEPRLMRLYAAGRCRFDKLILMLGGVSSSTLYMTRTICGRSYTRMPQLSRGNVMGLRFVTDSSNTGRGFSLQYKSGTNCAFGRLSPNFTTLICRFAVGFFGQQVIKVKGYICHPTHANASRLNRSQAN